MQPALPLAGARYRSPGTHAANLRPDDTVDLKGEVGVVVHRVAVTWEVAGVTVIVEGRTRSGDLKSFTMAGDAMVVPTARNR